MSSSMNVANIASVTQNIILTQPDPTLTDAEYENNVTIGAFKTYVYFRLTREYAS
jgi:hypothetical protein